MARTGTEGQATLRLAFIGAGGVLAHQARHLKPVPGVEAYAAADVSEGALRAARETYGIGRTYADYRRMLADLPEIDAVSVCTPNAFHAEHAIAALEAGKHVLVEKPMATSAADAARMADAAQASGRQLVVGFQYRFDPRVRMLRRHVEAGAFGKLLYVRAQALRRRGIPSWGQFGNRDLQGGGPLIDLGVHVLEAAHYLLGSPPPLAATGGTFSYIGTKPCEAEAPWGPWDHRCHGVEDLAVGMVRFDGGAMLTVETSFAAHIEKDVWNIELMGERGGANLDAGKIFADQNGYMMTLSPAHLPADDPFELKMRHFVDVALGRRFNEAPPEHGLMVQQMIDMLYASADRGRETRVEPATE